VPKPPPPPSTPRYNVQDIQSLRPSTRSAQTASSSFVRRDVRKVFPNLVSKRPELIERLVKRGVSYIEEAEARRQANVVSNREAMPGIIDQMGQQFGRNYVEGMVGFNALPGIVEALTNRPLQTMVNYGSTGLQKRILQTLGPKLGAGAARFADTALMGGTATIPALNIGSAYLLQQAPPGAVNVPRHQFRYSSFTEKDRVGGRSPDFLRNIWR